MGKRAKNRKRGGLGQDGKKGKAKKSGVGGTDDGSGVFENGNSSTLKHRKPQQKRNQSQEGASGKKKTDKNGEAQSKPGPKVDPHKNSSSAKSQSTQGPGKYVLVSVMTVNVLTMAGLVGGPVFILFTDLGWNLKYFTTICLALMFFSMILLDLLLPGKWKKKRRRHRPVPTKVESVANAIRRSWTFLSSSVLSFGGKQQKQNIATHGGGLSPGGRRRGNQQPIYESSDVTTTDVDSFYSTRRGSAAHAQLRHMERLLERYPQSSFDHVREFHKKFLTLYMLNEHLAQTLPKPTSSMAASVYMSKAITTFVRFTQEELASCRKNYKIIFSDREEIRPVSQLNVFDICYSYTDLQLLEFCKLFSRNIIKNEKVMVKQFQKSYTETYRPKYKSSDVESPPTTPHPEQWLEIQKLHQQKYTASPSPFPKKEDDDDQLSYQSPRQAESLTPGAEGVDGGIHSNQSPQPVIVPVELSPPVPKLSSLPATGTTTPPPQPSWSDYVNPPSLNDPLHFHPWASTKAQSLARRLHSSVNFKQKKDNKSNTQPPVAMLLPYPPLLRCIASYLRTPSMHDRPAIFRVLSKKFNLSQVAIPTTWPTKRLLLHDKVIVPLTNITTPSRRRQPPNATFEASSTASSSSPLLTSTDALTSSPSQSLSKQVCMLKYYETFLTKQRLYLVRQLHLNFLEMDDPFAQQQQQNSQSPGLSPSTPFRRLSQLLAGSNPSPLFSAFDGGSITSSLDYQSKVSSFYHKVIKKCIFLKELRIEGLKTVQFLTELLENQQQEQARYQARQRGGSYATPASTKSTSTKSTSTKSTSTKSTSTKSTSTFTPSPAAGLVPFTSGVKNLSLIMSTKVTTKPFNLFNFGACFPSLQSFELFGYNRIEAAHFVQNLPIHSLKQLKIVDCFALKVIPEAIFHLSNLTLIHFSGLPNLLNVPSNFLYNFQNVKIFHLESTGITKFEFNEKSTKNNNIQQTIPLNELRLIDNESLLNPPCDFTSLKTIKTFIFQNNPNVQLSLSDLEHLSTLQHLTFISGEQQRDARRGENTTNTNRASKARDGPLLFNNTERKQHTSRGSSVANVSNFFSSSTSVDLKKFLHKKLPHLRSLLVEQNTLTWEQQEVQKQLLQSKSILSHSKRKSLDNHNVREASRHGDEPSKNNIIKGLRHIYRQRMQDYEAGSTGSAPDSTVVSGAEDKGGQRQLSSESEEDDEFLKDKHLIPNEKGSEMFLNKNLYIERINLHRTMSNDVMHIVEDPEVVRQRFFSSEQDNAKE